MVLDVARRDVVDHRVPEDVAHRVSAFDIRASATDDDAQLGFPVDHVADRRIDHDVIERTGHRRLRLGEDRRRLDLLTPGLRAFSRMLLKVSTDGQHVSPWRIERREHCKILEFPHPHGAAGAFGRGDDFTQPGKTFLSALDEGQDVRRRGRRTIALRQLAHVDDLLG